MKNSESISLGMVVPVYNKSRELKRALSNLVRVVKEYNYTILVIDDASTDSSYEIISEIASHNCRILFRRNELNLGKGGTLLSGLTQLSQANQIIGYIDADLDIDPISIHLMIDGINSQKCDIAIGSKVHHQSEVAYPMSRRFLSFLYFILTFFILRNTRRDMQTGLKLLKSDSVVSVLNEVKSKGFAFDTELLIRAQRNGLLIRDFPVKLNHNFGTSLTLVSATSAIKDLLVIRKTLGR